MKNEPIIYKAICAACGVTVREGVLFPGGYVSHGSCRVCARYQLNQMEITLSERGLNDQEKREGRDQHQAKG